MSRDDRNDGRDSLQSVPVVIGGREYRLRGHDPASLGRLAARVDGTLRELTGGSRPPDDFKLAVLAALNIAGEEEEARAAWADHAAALGRRARALSGRLERLRDRVARPGA